MDYLYNQPQFVTCHTWGLAAFAPPHNFGEEIKNKKKNDIYHTLIIKLSKNSLKSLKSTFVSEFPAIAHEATGKTANEL